MSDEVMEKHLPLEGTHTAAGARMMPLAGWLVPAHYGDPEAEYHAIAAGRAVLDFSFLTKVVVRGNDRLDYLNRRLSQRVIELAPGEALRANQLNGEGRMEADMMVLGWSEGETLLLAPPAVGGPYLAQLGNKFVFTEDCTFTDVTAAWASFVVGPAVLAGLGVAPGAPGRLAPAKVAEVEVTIAPCPFVDGGVLSVLLVRAAAAAAVWAALLDASAVRAGFMPYDSWRVERGLAWWGIDLNNRSIPLDADLRDAIHPNKGCYPGQETIARITNLGHPARKLMGIIWDGGDAPPAGQPVMRDGAEAGTLSSSTYSPRLGRAVGLAMMKWKDREPGTVVTSADGLRGVVVALPLDGKSA
jgi:folate-binding protein YgfZ